MGVGNVILFLCLTYIFHNRVHGLTLVDLGYWLTVAAMAAVRWVDIRSFHGDTVTGEPATLSHWRRYALCLTAGALVAWIVIHLLALTGGR
jgi:predicted membrane metal-binding protein